MPNSKNKELRQSRVRQMKNQLILEAALTVFAQKGYHNTRLEDISYEAGFSKATLYNYYKDKEDIFLTLLIDRYHDVYNRRGLDTNPEAYKTRTLAENIRFNLTINFEELGEHFAFIRTSNEYIFNTYSALQRDNSDALNPRHKELAEIANLLEQNLIDIFTHAKANNEIRSTLAIPQIVVFYQSLLSGIIADWRRRGVMGDMEETINCVVEFTLHGCQ